MMWQFNRTYELMVQGLKVLKKLAVGFVLFFLASWEKKEGGTKRDIPALTFLAEQITEPLPELV